MHENGVLCKKQANNLCYAFNPKYMPLQKLYLFVFFAAALTGFAFQKTRQPERIFPYKNKDLSIQQRVDDLYSRMNLQEKVAQVSAYQLNKLIIEAEGGKSDTKVTLDNALKNGIGFVENAFDTLEAVQSVEKINKIQAFLKNTRLGIPAIVGSEGLHGYTGTNSTVFPSPIAIGCSFDPELVKKAYDIVGREARARGSSEIHGIVLDIGRDPRWGRIEETFGEDTYLNTMMGIACVSGLQGGISGNPDTSHVISSPKHFAGYAQVDGGRNFAPTHFTYRTFMDQILPPFEAAIKVAHAQGIMASHGDIDGIPAHGNQWLLTQVLKQQWGFQGVVVSDYMDISRLDILHHVAANQDEAAEMALRAGIDVDLPTGAAYKNLVRLVAQKPELMPYLEQAVKRVLRLKFMLGLFENPFSDAHFAKTFVNNDAHINLSKQLADKCVVLLKNSKNILPLKKENIKTIAVIGPKAADRSLGTYTMPNDKAISILEAIQHEAGSAIKVLYHEGCKIANYKVMPDGEEITELIPISKEQKSISAAVNTALQADAVILCLGDEHFTVKEAVFKPGKKGDRSELTLLGNQLALARQLIATGKPVVIVLKNGRPISIPELNAEATSIMEVFNNGMMTGPAVCDAIFGKTNPGGKLSVSVPKSVGQLPVYYSQNATGTYKDYILEDSKPLYPFGYGLSYTTFSYTGLNIEDKVISSGRDFKFSFIIKNTGNYTGDEVVQVYVHDKVASVLRPVKELKRFERVALKPGESKLVSFTLNPAIDLSFTNNENKKVAEPGEFDLMIGASSADIKLSAVISLK